MSTLIVNPIGSQNLMFRRTTNRYGKRIGTLSSNRGFLKISRSMAPGTRGQFAPRPA